MRFGSGNGKAGCKKHKENGVNCKGNQKKQNKNKIFFNKNNCLWLVINRKTITI